MAEPGRDGALASELVEAFTRLSQGDFSVRLPRNLRRDTEDALAFFVNLIAEQLDRLMADRDRARRQLESDVTGLLEKFLALAAGDFNVRVARTGSGDAIDVLAFMFNNMVGEISGLFAERDRQRIVLETILESMADGVLLLDGAGRVVRCNGAMARLLGYEPHELVGRPVVSLLASSESDLAARLREHVDAGTFRSRNALFRTKAGQALATAVSASPHRDEAGTLLGVVLVARDDRELRQAQMQLRMSDRLTTMGTLAAGVAHEINNPLAFVIANLEFISEELGVLAIEGTLSDDRVTEMLSALKASRGGADRVRQIVLDLRGFSRSDPEATSQIDLHKLLDLTVSLSRNEIRHHARLVKQYGEVPIVQANEVRLIQVFLNLVQNAVQAIPVGNAAANEIAIVTGTDQTGSAFVEVKDTGSGISAENLPLIFDLYFTTRPEGGGTGLGLSICLRLVEQCGGRIDVRSRAGEGSAFRVTLPASPTAGSTRDMRTPMAIQRPRLPRMKILVIDDESEVGESIRRILGRDHDVSYTTRAAEALRLLSEQTYDLLLCDLLMPDITGMELHERLVVSHPDVAHRMVFMSGGAFSVAAREFLSRVPNVRMEKPFDASALRALVDASRSKR